MIRSLSSQIENEFIKKYFGGWIAEIDLILEDVKEMGRSEIRSAWSDFLSEKYPGWSWAGSGYFRWVLAPNSSYVVKFTYGVPNGGAKSGRGELLNKFESERQLEFEGLFPKVYFHHPQWKWIVVERVRPATSEDLSSIFLLDLDTAYNFPAYLEYYSIQEYGGNQDELRVLRESIDKSDDDFHYYLQTLKSYSLFRRLAAVSRKLNLWQFDLRVGNLGINKEGKLVIIDSSFPIDL